VRRLLDAVVAERQKLPPSAHPSTHVVALGQAAKANKSAVSFLVGDTADFESDVILQCSAEGSGTPL